MTEHHLIFFDATCPLCQKAVGSLRKRDKRGIFAFYPLESEEAKAHVPPALFREDTLILKEMPQGKLWIRGKAVFRIFGLLGGAWGLLGWLCYLPGIDGVYRFIARHRHFF